MRQRIIFGLVAAAVLVGIVLKGNLVLVRIAVVGLATVAYLEFDKLFFSPSKGRQVRMALLICLNILAAAESDVYGWFSMWLSIIFLGALRVFRSNRTGQFQEEMSELALELLGFVYIFGLFGFMIPIWLMYGGPEYLLLLFMIVFFGDTAAYFVGIRIGKHRLATNLSPKKSIEGAVAAVFGSALGVLVWTFVISARPFDGGYLTKLLLFVPVASLLAQLGDLFESLFKRSQAQKDSGTFLPGHGGLLDRIDGLALLAPVYYMFLVFVLERP